MSDPIRPLADLAEQLFPTWMINGGTPPGINDVRTIAKFLLAAADLSPDLIRFLAAIARTGQLGQLVEERRLKALT